MSKLEFRPLKGIIALGSVASLLALGSACGDLRTQGDRVITLEATQRQAAQDQRAADWKGQIAEMIETSGLFASLYSQADGQISTDSARGMLHKLKAQIEARSGVADIAWDEFVGLVTQMYPELKDGIQPSDVWLSVRRQVPYLKWFDTKNELTAEDLESALTREFPESSAATRSELGAVLLNSDRPFMGGNADGRLSRAELALPLFILSSSQKTNPSAGLSSQIVGWTGSRLTDKQFDYLIEAQIALRHAQSAQQLKASSLGDYKLEVAQLVLRLAQTHAAIEHWGTGGNIFPAQLSEAMLEVTGSAWLLTEQNRASRYYDHSVLGGNEDGKWDFIELMLMSQDARFAEKLHHFALQHNSDNRERKKGALALDALSARVFGAIYGGEIRSADLERIRKYGVFNENRVRALSNSKESALEVVAQLHATDLVYYLYDIDRSGTLSRTELDPLVNQFGLESDREKKAFYKNVGLNKGANQVFSFFKLMIPGKGPKELTASGFLDRFERISTRL